METICMKCQNLFSGKKKNNNNSICHLLKILPRVLNIKSWKPKQDCILSHCELCESMWRCLIQISLVKQSVKAHFPVTWSSDSWLTTPVWSLQRGPVSQQNQSPTNSSSHSWCNIARGLTKWFNATLGKTSSNILVNIYQFLDKSPNHCIKPHPCMYFSWHRLTNKSN